MGASFGLERKEDRRRKHNHTESVKNERVVTALDFKDQGKAGATFLLKPQGAETQVTWTFEGDAGYNLISRYFYLFIDKLLR